jgi:hypothetical protein
VKNFNDTLKNFLTAAEPVLFNEKYSEMNETTYPLSILSLETKNIQNNLLAV